MLRIFAQVNYSNPKNPGADSGIQMQASMINALLKMDPGIYFYVLLPESAAAEWKLSFEHERIRVLVTQLPPRQSGGAFHFDSRALDKLIDFRCEDVDLLLINQPELVPAFLDYFNKRHFFHVPAISYIHWLDWRRYDSIKNRAVEPSIVATLAGALLSTKVACNSEYGRNRILKVAGRWFNDSVLKDLAGKLVSLHPAVDAPRSPRSKRAGNRKKIQIIVPHRAQKYTGFKTLIEKYFPRVWRVRQDFEVLLTNPSRYDFIRGYEAKHPFVTVLQLDRVQYLKALWRADIIIGSHVGCNQWSVATLEGICADCVPLLSNEGFYKEMLTPLIKPKEWPRIWDRWFYFRGEFVNRLLALMDSLEEERKMARVIGRRARRHYDWRAVAKQWADLFETVARTAPVVGSDSSAFRALLKEIELHGSRRKMELLNRMRWHPKSRHIPWTKYRRRLLMVTEETPNTSEVIFSSNGRRPPRHLTIPLP
jgi:glycosyltransferase involved in cell wall biosynthesis